MEDAYAVLRVIPGEGPHVEAVFSCWVEANNYGHETAGEFEVRKVKVGIDLEESKEVRRYGRF